MNSLKSPALPDWSAITVRWVFLVGVILWLSLGAEIAMVELAVLALTGLANVLITTLVAMDKSSRELRLGSVALDMLFAYLMFYLSLERGGDLTWVSFLPLISAALYFQLAGAILLVVVNLVVQGGIAILNTPQPDPTLYVELAALLVLYLVIGLPVVYVSQRMSKGFRWPKRVRRSRRGGPASKELEQRRTIFDLITALSASLNYHKVLETCLDLSTDTLEELGAPAEWLVSAVLLFSSNDRKSPELSVATSRRLSPRDRGMTLPGTKGLIGHTIDEGISALSKDVGKDPELSQLNVLRECQSAYCVPLRTGLDAYGILLFAHPDIEFFTPERQEVLDIVGKQSVIAIQNARLYQDLEQEKNRMTEIQEESRKKLARDLHDGPTQSISAIAMRVNFARRLLERDVKAASEELFKIEDLARKTTKEIRHMLFTLRPLVLESQGLIAALQSMAEKMKETFNQEVIVQADPRVVDALEGGKQAVVFYIAEEAVNNARKHAQAPHVWVRLKMLRDEMGLLEVEDDGVGFDISAVDATYDNRGSLGMVNLRERTELVNGVLRIDSTKGRGTRVHVILPLTEEAADRIRSGS